MRGLHPRCNVTNRLVGTLGRQPGRVGHGSDLRRGKQGSIAHALGIQAGELTVVNFANLLN